MSSGCCGTLDFRVCSEVGDTRSSTFLLYIQSELFSFPYLPAADSISI